MTMFSPTSLSHISLTIEDYGCSSQVESSSVLRRSLIEIEVQKIADDDTLNESAKIDLIAEKRRWFRGDDMSIVDNYLIGKVSAEQTAAKLAETIDEAYSTADHSRQYYECEEAAKHQRTFHTPEEALKLWGPPQEFPEPSEELKSLPSTEG